MSDETILTQAEAICGVADRTLPFSLECVECDAGMDIQSAEQALLSGWNDVRADDGPAWNYLGHCPECARDEKLRLMGEA